MKAEDKRFLDDLEGTAPTKKKGSGGQGQREEVEEDVVDFIYDPYWSPTPYSAFKLLISVRFAAGLWTTISDCDETYNYWEPVIVVVSFTY